MFAKKENVFKISALQLVNFEFIGICRYYVKYCVP